MTVAYGDVPVGASKTASFALTNTGGAPVTISVSKAPFTADFHATTTLGEGTAIPGGSTIMEMPVFVPPGEPAAKEQKPEVKKEAPKKNATGAAQDAAKAILLKMKQGKRK